MESLSRPFHGNQASSATFSKKLSTANSFSAGNAYDDVFTSAPKFGGPTYSSRIEDYNEIFGGSQASRASSVPILDLSAPGEAEVLADVRSSKLDYSNIFGGFREDIAVSFEEMFAKPKGAKNLSDDARTPAKTASPSDRSDHLNRNKEEAFSYEVPNQSIEGMKQFNVSYHNTSQRSNDRTNGTTHVAQLRNVPGFTCFIDENPALQKTKLDKSEPQTKVDVNLTKQQTSDGLGKFKSQSSGEKFYSNENNPKRHASKVSSPSSLPANLVSNKSEPKRSMASSFEVPKSDASKAGPGDCSPSFSDEEVDVNSAAAASAAALRKALEKAQASIKIAKEFMERKKDGTRRFSKQSSKDGLDVKKRREDKVTVEGKGIREKNAKKICENADVVLQVFAKSEREKARRSGKVAPNNNESLETSISKEVVGETNGNNLESAEDCQALRRFSELVNTGEHRTTTLACGHADGRNNVMQSVDAHECGKKEIKTAEEILEHLCENGKKVDEEAHELEAMEGKLNVVKMTRQWEQHVDRLDTAQEVRKHEEDDKAGFDQEDEETEEKQKVSSGQEKCEEKWVESLEPEENEEVFVSQDWRENNNDGLDASQECVENEKKREEVFEKEQNMKSLKDVHKEERENRLKKICEQDEIEKRLQTACEWVDYEEACEVESNQKRENDAHEGEDNEKRLDKIHELDIYNKRLNGTRDGEESEERQEDDSDCEGKEKIYMEAYEFEETEGIQRETAGNEMTEVNQETVKETINLDPISDSCKREEGESRSESQEAHRHKEIVNGLNIKKNERISDFTQSSCEFEEDEKEFEAVEVVHELGEEEMCKTGGLVGGAVEYIEIQNKVKYATDALLFKDNPENIDLTDTNSGPRQTDREEESELAPNVGSRIKISACESGEDEKKSVDKIASYLEEVKNNSDTAHKKRQWVEMRKKMEASQPHSVFKGEEKTTGINEVTKKGQITEKNAANLHKTFAVEEKETKGTTQKEVKVENEQLGKNDEANKREREQEKDRMAVGRAIREARERAFAEARERAERAVVERATAEARQRVMAEAREKFEKSSAATKSSAEKASIEAKLRAERAAVERATTEARERALEKALSQKATSGAKGQAERFVSEKFSGVSRDRQSFPSSDKQRLDGTIGESTQRSKARLERHQRTMERAAKALAEKNRRDLLAHKEQAERNRLAETLDAEVKRWSSGKAGNLRALLSTLQYILGRDSGWQPISLTDIITTDAVKKAYRKATLHVHPDKLQQRGASIQQKYICEKVFDLLKAAWNKFNSEER